MSRDLLDTAYLDAAMRTSDYRRQIVASATGTTVKHTPPRRSAPLSSGPSDR